MKTKKEPINSFWMGEAPLDDLAKIQEYLKPRGPSELLGFFVTQPPLPPSAEPEEPQQLDPPSPDPVIDELLEMYGITPEQFARSAIDEPELWEDDELERLHAVLSGDLPPRAIADVVFEHMRSGGSSKPKQQVVQAPTSEDIDLEGLGSDHLEVPLQPMPGPEPTMEGVMDVGEWWSKRKS